MTEHPADRRRYQRYDTDVKIYFHVNYDFETKVIFRIIRAVNKKSVAKKYSALSKNINVEGICFLSEKELLRGDQLLLEVYLPSRQKPVKMESIVIWCRPVSGKNDAGKFETGVHIVRVNNKPVSDSVYFDKTYKVIWSNVLESVLGNFRLYVQSKKNS